MSDKTEKYLFFGAIALGGYVIYNSTAHKNRFTDNKPPYVENKPLTSQLPFTTKPDEVVHTSMRMPWNYPSRPIQVPQNPSTYHQTEQFLINKPRLWSTGR